VVTGGRGGGATVATAPAPKKKLFLTDGWNVALTGVCVYMFRLNISKQLPEEGFHKVLYITTSHFNFHNFVRNYEKDLYCGVIDVTRVGLVTTIERIVEHVFMQALAHPAADADDDHAHWPAVRNQLLPSLRSFCSALRGNVILQYLLLS
jgi:dynein heavy chain, axonemal